MSSYAGPLAVDVDNAILSAAVRADDVGLYPEEGATADEVSRVMRASDLPEHTRAFRTGDGDRFLRAMYGGRSGWAENAPDIGIDLKTRENRMAVASAWPDVADRRHYIALGLSWSHFNATAHIARHDLAEARDWMNEAVLRRWSANDLRRRIRGEPPVDPEPDPAAVSRIAFCAWAGRSALAQAGLEFVSPETCAMVAAAVIQADERWRGVNSGDEWALLNEEAPAEAAYRLSLAMGDDLTL